MIRFLIQGHGGQLYYFFGGRTLNLLNMTLLTHSHSSLDTTLGQANANRISQSLVSSPIERLFYRGTNTWYPGSYANHKGIAFYENKLYQTLEIPESPNAGSFITRFDGSGLFINEGDARFEANEWMNGRGTELLNASGTTSTPQNNLHWLDRAHLSYNGILWILGQAHLHPGSTDAMFTKEGWENVGAFGTGGNASITRTFDWAYIKVDKNKNEKRVLGPITSIGSNASNEQYNHTTDAFGFNNDIYLGTWADIIRYPGCSGTPSSIDFHTSQPSAKCFLNHPESGIVNGKVIGDDWLLCLTGSGTIKRVHTNRTHTITDLRDINIDIRTGGNWTPRLNSSTAEPGRSCLLKRFNNKLHAFVATATSGYKHFVNTGNPSGVTNWTDNTESLPDDLRRWDSNVFGYSDKNFLYVAQYTMGDLDIWGYGSNKRSNGAVYLYKFGTDDKWTEIYSGVIGLPPRGLVPYMNYGPSVLTPSGSNPEFLKASDYTVLQYRLYDLFKRKVDVNVEYSTDKGITWNSARRFRSYSDGTPQGSGVSNLDTHPDGILYEFFWDHVNDLGFNSSKEVRLRIRPNLVRN